MPIDFQRASSVRLYPHEQGAFRGLPILTKAVASYLCKLVDPMHGWLPLAGASVAAALRHHCSGTVSASDSRRLGRGMAELLDEGYVLRCQVGNGEAQVFITDDQRDVPLSNWLEDPDGDWLVIANWVPAQNSLSIEETRAWHAERRQRATPPTPSNA